MWTFDPPPRRGPGLGRCGTSVSRAVVPTLFYLQTTNPGQTPETDTVGVDSFRVNVPSENSSPGRSTQTFPPLP